MANILTKMAAIRNAIFGSDVRENIASGIESINTEVENTTGRQTTLEADMSTAKLDAIQATEDANIATTEANTARDNANTKATLADTKATLADQKATLADSKATLAQTATDNANTTVTNVNNNTLIIYKPWVANFAAIATTYPAPLVGWTTQTIDTNTRYRYNGTTWINIGVYADDKTGDMGQITETNLVAAILKDRSSLADNATHLSSFLNAQKNNSDEALDNAIAFALLNSKTILIDDNYIFAQSHTLPSGFTVLSKTLDHQITYTGSGYLFNVTAYYSKPVTLSKLRIHGTGVGTGSAINANFGAWGTGIILDNCFIDYFDIAINITQGYNCKIINSIITNNRIGIKFSIPALGLNNVNLISGCTLASNKCCIDGDTISTLLIQNTDFESSEIAISIYRTSTSYSSNHVSFKNCWFEGISIATVLPCQYDYTNKIPINFSTTYTEIKSENINFENCTYSANNNPNGLNILNIKETMGLSNIFELEGMTFYSHEKKLLNNDFKLKFKNIVTNPLLLNVTNGCPANWYKGASVTVSDIVDTNLGVNNSNIKQLVSTVNNQKINTEINVQTGHSYIYMVEAKPINKNDSMQLLITNDVGSNVNSVPIVLDNINSDVYYGGLFTANNNNTWGIGVYAGTPTDTINHPIHLISVSVYDVTYLATLGFSGKDIFNILRKYLGFGMMTTALGFGRTDPNGDGVADIPYGTTLQRPILDSNFVGFLYFDTTIGKNITWDGTAWKDYRASYLANSVATDVATLVSSFNSLLLRLQNAGVMKTS
jgi:hypothetical protein